MDLAEVTTKEGEGVDSLFNVNVGHLNGTGLLNCGILNALYTFTHILMQYYLSILHGFINFMMCVMS